MVIKRGVFVFLAAIFAFSAADRAAGQEDRQSMAAPGLYVSIHGGAMWLSQSESSIPADGDKAFTDYDRGERLGAAVGYGFDRNFSAELELSHAMADVSFLTLNNVVDSNPCPAPCNIFALPASGSADLTSLVANVMAATEWNGLRPYVGVGAGLAIVHSKTGVSGVVGPFEDTNETWTVQAMVGTDYAVTDAVSIGGRYRAQWVGPFTINDGARIKVDDSFWQSGEIVLTYRFN